MALSNLPLFLYGFDIDSFNQYINFRAVTSGPVLTGTLQIGNYTCTQFMAAIKSALEIADPANVYTVTLDRTVSSGRSNRMRVQTSGVYLDLLFGTGPNAMTSPATLMGFLQADYTGGINYAGSNQAGIVLIPKFPTWNYVSPDEMVEQDGVKNVTSTGIKETLVFAQMQFFQGEWRYITDTDGTYQRTQWIAFLKYATKQLKFEFSPSIVEDPTVFYQCTLESTPADGMGMKYTLEQMVALGLFRYYQTGKNKFRVLIT